MSKYYKPQRTRDLFDPNSEKPFKLSRSKIDLFINCPRCFYFDRRLGVGRPPGFPFNLNNAVDKLLKKEFDIHRAEKTSHPLMDTYGIDAVPFAHKDIETWRENFRGLRFYDEPSNFVITGAVDDVWVNPRGELLVVDYKATSKESEVNIDALWQDAYKRQMEIYQWLLRNMGFQVSDTGYFVYVNGRTDLEAFDGRLEFEIKIIPYIGKDSWIAGTLKKIRNCLENDNIPKAHPECDWCQYRKAIDLATKRHARKGKLI